jgi:hypothetical protein
MKQCFIKYSENPKNSPFQLYVSAKNIPVTATIFYMVPPSPVSPNCFLLLEMSSVIVSRVTDAAVYKLVR